MSTYFLARRLVASRTGWPEWIAALLGAVTVPNVLYVFHFYPEIPAAFLVAGALLVMIRGRGLVLAGILGVARRPTYTSDTGSYMSVNATDEEASSGSASPSLSSSWLPITSSAI